MDLLPNIEIEADIENLNLNVQSDDDFEPENEMVEPETPFIEKPNTSNTKIIKETESEIMEFDQEKKRLTEKPKKKRKPPSEKQLAALAKNRQKALETRRAKAEAKKRAVKEVIEEHDIKKLKKKQLVETDTDKMFNEKIENEKQERIKKEIYDDEQQFANFMNNMEKYSKMRYEFDKKREDTLSVKRQELELERNKAIEKVKKSKVIASKVLTAAPAPYDQSDDWFGGGSTF